MRGKNRYARIFLCIIFCLNVTVFTVAVPSVEISADKSAVGVGERIRVRAIVEQLQSEIDKLDAGQIKQITPPACSLLEMLDSRQITSTKLKQDKIVTQRIFVYDFKAKGIGSEKISPLIIEYARKSDSDEIKILKSREIEIKVLPFWQRWGALVLKFGFLILTLFFAAVWIKRKQTIKKQKTAIAEVNAEPEKEFLEKIEDTQVFLLEAQLKKYYQAIQQALEEYFQSKYQICVFNTESLSAAKVPLALSEIFGELKDLTEKVKFSGYVPDKNEQEKVFRSLKAYFQNIIKAAEIEKIEIIENIENTENSEIIKNSGKPGKTETAGLKKVKKRRRNYEA